MHVHGWPTGVREWTKCPTHIEKALFVKRLQIVPPEIFLEDQLPANYVRFRVTPDLVIAIGSHVKVAGEGLLGKQVELVVSASSDPLEMQAYGELLGDALAGNSSRFARQDYVEEAWRIVDPILDNATPVHLYSPGTWGPTGAEALAPPEGWMIPPGQTPS
jgi:glucose-6-phosphate 1-dehydrogenase